MRITRIYHPGPYESGDDLTLSAFAAHHLIHVLRATLEMPLHIFDGCGHCFEAVILEITKKQIRVRVSNSVKNLTESSLQLHLGQALVRGEKMDFIVQKAVELGIHTFTPLLTEFVNFKLAEDRLEKRIKHWQEIIIQASEQCERDYLMILNEPLLFEKWIEKTEAELKFIFHPSESPSVFDPKIKPQHIAYTIGPEGGFSDREVNFTARHGFKVLSLGNRILRTETAGIVGASVLSAHYGEW